MQKLAIFTLCISFTFAPMLVSAQANEPTLTITEAMPNPTGSDTDLEWIELTNFAQTETELSTWKLNGSALPAALIQPLEIIVLARNPAAVRTEYSVHNRIFQVSFSLGNSSGTIRLSDVSNVETSFSYPQSEEGRSFELLLGSCQTIVMHPDSHSIGYSNHICGYTTPTPTPSATVTATATPTPSTLPGGEYSHLLSISALMPYPESGSEWVELSNLDQQAVDLTGWILEDSSGYQYTIATGIVATGSSFKIYPQKVTLNNNGDIILLKDPRGYQVDLFSYKSSKKGVLITNGEQPIADGEADTLACSTTPVKTPTASNTSAVPLDVPVFYPAH